MAIKTIVDGVKVESRGKTASISYSDVKLNASDTQYDQLADALAMLQLPTLGRKNYKTVSTKFYFSAL